MIDGPRQGAGSDKDRQAPELHNSEQDDELDQSQTVADEALHGAARQGSPLDSTKVADPNDTTDDSTQDLIDHMRDMEQSGRIDMGACRGEPNMDDDEGKYGSRNKIDDLPED